MLDVMRGPTASQSWKDWCLALHLCTVPGEVQMEWVKANPQTCEEITRRMRVIRATNSIPLKEFL